VSYISHVLQPGEKIRYQGSVSWLILYLPAIILAIVGAVASAFAPGWIIAAVSFFAALMFALRAWLIRRMTEFAFAPKGVVPNRRDCHPAEVFDAVWADVVTHRPSQETTTS